MESQPFLSANRWWLMSVCVFVCIDCFQGPSGRLLKVYKE